MALADPSNNGTDRLVAARHLRRWGAEVVCCLLTRRYGVEILPLPDADMLERLLRRSSLVIEPCCHRQISQGSVRLREVDSVKVVTATQMAAIEQASERADVSADTLMENARLSVAQAAWDELGGVSGVRIVALVGPGNNGADGLVAGRHLRRWGAEVVCCPLTWRLGPKLELARRYGVEIQSLPDADVLERLRQQGTRRRLRSDAPQRPPARRRAGNMTAIGKSVKAVFGDGRLTA